MSEYDKLSPQLQHELEQLQRRFKEAIKDQPLETQRALLARYCLSLLAHADRGAISTALTGYLIADTMSYGQLDDDEQSDEIFIFGSEQEVPELDTEEHWLRLQKRIYDLARDTHVLGGDWA